MVDEKLRKKILDRYDQLIRKDRVFPYLSKAEYTHPVPDVIDDHRYVAGLESANLVGSAACLVVIDITVVPNAIVNINRWVPNGWQGLREKVISLFQQWSLISIWADKNSVGSVNTEAFWSEGIPVRPVNMDKRNQFFTTVKMSSTIENKQLALIEDKRLLDELWRVRFHPNPKEGRDYNDLWLSAGATDIDTNPPYSFDASSFHALVLAWYGVMAHNMGRGVEVDWLMWR